MTENHEVTTRPATPEDGTRVPGSTALSCICGWNTVVITIDPDEAARQHMEQPDRRTPHYEIWVR